MTVTEGIGQSFAHFVHGSGLELTKRALEKGRRWAARVEDEVWRDRDGGFWGARDAVTEA